MRPVLHSIHYPFSPDAGLGELKQERDYERHVQQLMLQVLFTAPGERINRPDFGCGIRQMLFEPNSHVGANLAKVAIHQALERWLSSLIRVHQVEVVATQETAQVKIAYALKAVGEQRFLNVEVTL